jgi:hypothetical protein
VQRIFVPQRFLEIGPATAHRGNAGVDHAEGRELLIGELSGEGRPRDLGPVAIVEGMQ